MARGLAPVGSRSGPLCPAVISSQQTLRLLRSRTGASPLATGMHSSNIHLKNNKLNIYYFPI
ncbi:hypothetical protein C5612_26220 [Pseudomonas frederiksbergensis]|uniref:Uncharacterized protein n=1 Tax=Pseudomonas frederiksbergensis TaxID=104087 RepID=A0A2S8H977_9PSED|nr:hypothetical protein C5612_26220 [Pseudomonas frederiksbergensis]